MANLESILLNTLGKWYELPAQMVDRLFGDCVDQVYCGDGYSDYHPPVFEFNHNGEYILPDGAGMVIVFKNKRVVAINPSIDNLTLSSVGGHSHY